MPGLEKENIKLHIEHLNSLVSGAFYSIRRKRAVSLFLIFIAAFSIFFIIQILFEAFFYLPGYFKISYLLVSLIFSIAVTSIFAGEVSAGTFKQFYNHFSQFSDNESVRNALDLYLFKSGKTSFDHLAIDQNLRNLQPGDIESSLKIYTAKSSRSKNLHLCSFRHPD